ncbi:MULTISPECIES: hypothetical protein [Nocardia]|nr:MULTISPECIES: hypothetical protein [Nocardia]
MSTGTASAHPGSATVGPVAATVGAVAPAAAGATTTAAQPISPNTPAQQMRNAILTAEPGSRVGIDVVDTAADGTDQYFGIPDALTGTDWAIKQGWMTLDDSTTLNTTGLVSADPAQPGRFVVVVLTTQPAGTAWTTGGAAVTAAISALRETLAPTTAVAAASTETVTCSSICPASDR